MKNAHSKLSPLYIRSTEGRKRETNMLIVKLNKYVCDMYQYPKSCTPFHVPKIRFPPKKATAVPIKTALRTNSSRIIASWLGHKLPPPPANFDFNFQPHTVSVHSPTTPV